MFASKAMTIAGHDDAELVGECLAGNRDAYGQIVARYQSLICSLAYSATGSLSQSEDLAQETFFTAWKQLRDLREPGRLRAWLCGIARNLINNWLRRQGREPSHFAATLDEVHELPAPGPLPSALTMGNEEAAILWRSLERIPEIYREPLVLFYREHQSVERVAESLDLSEEAVKQRLSRGRKLLHEQVLAFVEGALARTNPGKAFTVAVLAALPALVPQSAAAGMAATAVQGSALAKSAATAGLAAAFLGPVIGLLGGWFGAHMSIKNTQSPRERKFMIRSAWLCAGLVALSGLVMFGLVYFGRSLVTSHRMLYFGLILALGLIYCAALLEFILWSNRRQRQIQIEDGTYVEASARLASPAGPPNRAAIYGGLGGSIFGGTAWLAIMAFRAHDWWGVGIVAVVAVVAFIVSTNVCLRGPQHYLSALMWVCVVLGVSTLALVNLRWSAWFGHDPEFKNWSVSGLSALIVLVYGIITLILWKQRRGARSA